MIHDIEKLIASINVNNNYKPLWPWEDVIQGIRNFPDKVKYIYPKSEAKNLHKRKWIFAKADKSPILRCPHRKVRSYVYYSYKGPRHSQRSIIWFCPKCGKQLYRKVRVS
ncbi:MAG: hypothetical protein J6T70_20825 [Bacteroidales bacterium]|nr:hypothetical protein [Bacteroidales bacterium]MBO7599486.1 hypothetical protein [Bacteroidales bacterium]